MSTKKNGVPFTANTQIACVSIDFTTYLLPLSKALKLVELLSGAVQCDRSYARDERYMVNGRLCEVSITTVNRNQISAAKADTSEAPLLLGNSHGN